MYDPELAPVGIHMDAVLDDFDTAECVGNVAAGKFIMIARHKHHTHALTRLAQNFLHNVVVRLRPVPVLAQLPTVDNVTYEVERLAIQPPQKLQERLGLTACRAQVNI